MRAQNTSRLEEKIKCYFDYCDSINGESQKAITKPYTLSGLLCFLGLSRSEFEAMSKKKRYSKIISFARAKIEAYIEENSLTGKLSCNASSNSLKYNFGWGEKQEREQQDTSKHITVTLSPDMKELAL